MFNKVNKLFVTAGAVNSHNSLCSCPCTSLTGDFDFSGSVRIFRASPQTGSNNYQFDFLRSGSTNDAGTAGDLVVGTSTGSFLALIPLELAISLR